MQRGTGCPSFLSWLFLHCMCTPRLFILSSVLGCVHLLAAVNNAAANTGVQNEGTSSSPLWPTLSLSSPVAALAGGLASPKLDHWVCWAERCSGHMTQISHSRPLSPSRAEGVISSFLSLPVPSLSVTFCPRPHLFQAGLCSALQCSPMSAACSGALLLRASCLGSPCTPRGHRSPPHHTLVKSPSPPS